MRPVLRFDFPLPAINLLFLCRVQITGRVKVVPLLLELPVGYWRWSKCDDHSASCGKSVWPCELSFRRRRDPSVALCSSAAAQIDRDSLRHYSSRRVPSIRYVNIALRTIVQYHTAIGLFVFTQLRGNQATDANQELPWVSLLTVCWCNDGGVIPSRVLRMFPSHRHHASSFGINNTVGKGVKYRCCVCYAFK